MNQQALPGADSDDIDFDTAIEEAADMVAAQVLHHIDTMYPAMWKAVSKFARMSIRNTIRSQFAAEARELPTRDRK